MKSRILFNSLTVAAAVLSLVACDKDGDLVYTDGADKAELATSASKIVLSKDNPDALALTFYWNENGDITLNNPLVAAPQDAVTNVVEMSADASFANKYEETVTPGVFECRYTVLQLNNITGRLGFEPGVEGDMYIRVRSSVGSNVEPKYSDALKISVTPFFIDHTTGHYLDKDKNDTGVILRSPDSNGVFNAFISAGAWENWWFLDPLNNYWGNLGVDGKAFYASSAADSWNFWFPGESGSYYVTVDTNEGWWSALHLDNLTVTGDASGEMTFNRSANQWTMPISVAQAGTINVTISGKGSYYNTESGTDAPREVRDIAFSGTSGALSFGNTAAAISVSVPAGESSLVLDLTDVLAPALSAGAGAPEVVVPEKLYFSGLVNWDSISDFLTLTDADAMTYGGAHYIDSEWGYRAYTSTSWDDAYKGAEGAEPLAGKLVKADSDGNIPAPEAGLYVMNYNMKDLSYVLTKVESVGCAGIGDNWDVQAMTQDTDNPEIFTYEYVKTAETPWGVKVLFNNDWNLFLGAGEKEGVAYLYTDQSKNGFAGDNDIANGTTVVLTVDLGKQTFSYITK